MPKITEQEKKESWDKVYVVTAAIASMCEEFNLAIGIMRKNGKPIVCLVDNDTGMVYNMIDTSFKRAEA